MQKAQQAAASTGGGASGAGSSAGAGSSSSGSGSGDGAGLVPGGSVGGVTFAGLGPNAKGSSPAKAQAYNYLVTHKVDPNDPRWASAAATALNQKTPGVYAAPTGQILAFGGEQIKTAPNGYGLAPGTYDGGAKGEFYAPPSGKSGGSAGKLGAADQLDASRVVMENNPADFMSWKRTATITGVKWGTGVFSVDFDKRDGAGHWPDFPVPGWNGGMVQYTLGLCFYENRWYCSAAIQFWYGRALPQTTGIAQNWYYDSVRWGPMARHQPAYGESVGVFVGEGNLRNILDGSQSPLRERSNVVVVKWPYPGGGSGAPPGEARTQSVSMRSAAPPGSSKSASSAPRQGVCGTPLTHAPAPQPNGDAIDLSRVVYDEGVDISSWKITSRLGDVSVGAGQLCTPHSMSGKWPAVDFFGYPSTKVEGNMWLFADIGGVWHGGAADWLRPGQTCKGEALDALGPNAFYNGREPLKSWTPCPGELVGFAVSMPARAGQWGAAERSNVVLVPWPGN